MTALYNKHRPKTFEEVVGQSAITNTLKRVLERGESQAFLFCGSSGVGKTTLARIAAKRLGCNSIIEIDAATYTGVDDMRKIQTSLQYKPLGKETIKCIIIDECHSLSKQAWQSLLKIVEEPPKHVYWFFCTTEAGRVPTTIKTRCSSFTLKSVSEEDLATLADSICKLEKITLAKGVHDLVVKEALGSPRLLLNHIDACRDAPNRNEAAQLLRSVGNSEPTLDLCRFLSSGGSWTKAMSIVNRMEDESPESVRINVCNYMAVALSNSNTDKGTSHLLAVLDAFEKPFNQSENKAPLMLAIGRVLFQGG